MAKPWIFEPPLPVPDVAPSLSLGTMNDAKTKFTPTVAGLLKFTRAKLVFLLLSKAFELQKEDLATQLIENLKFTQHMRSCSEDEKAKMVAETLCDGDLIPRLSSDMDTLWNKIDWNYLFREPKFLMDVLHAVVQTKDIAVLQLAEDCIEEAYAKRMSLPADDGSVNLNGVAVDVCFTFAERNLSRFRAALEKDDDSLVMLRKSPEVFFDRLREYFGPDHNIFAEATAVLLSGGDSSLHKRTREEVGTSSFVEQNGVRNSIRFPAQYYSPLNHKKKKM
jgi:hypothetical protein